MSIVVRTCLHGALGHPLVRVIDFHRDSDFNFTSSVYAISPCVETDVHFDRNTQTDLCSSYYLKSVRIIFTRMLLVMRRGWMSSNALYLCYIPLHVVHRFLSSMPGAEPLWLLVSVPMSNRLAWCKINYYCWKWSDISSQCTLGPSSDVRKAMSSSRLNLRVAKKTFLFSDETRRADP